MSNEAGTNNSNSHYLNSKLQPNSSAFQGNSDAVDQTAINRGHNTIHAPKTNIHSSTGEGEGTGTSWTGHGTDMSKIYNYGPLAINNNGNSSGSYHLAVR